MHGFFKVFSMTAAKPAGGHAPDPCQVPSRPSHAPPTSILHTLRTESTSAEHGWAGREHDGGSGACPPAGFAAVMEKTWENLWIFP